MFGPPFQTSRARPTVASALQVDSTELPGHGLGLGFGGHFYPLHKGIVTFGFGGELSASRVQYTVEPANESDPNGPTLRTTCLDPSRRSSRSISGKVMAWSYLSAGLGWARLSTEREDRPETESAPRVKALNYGGGARWFAKKHLAACSLDVRFYQINAQAAIGSRPAYPKVTMLVASGGVAFK